MLVELIEQLGFSMLKAESSRIYFGNRVEQNILQKILSSMNKILI